MPSTSSSTAPISAGSSSSIGSRMEEGLIDRPGRSRYPQAIYPPYLIQPNSHPLPREMHGGPCPDIVMAGAYAVEGVGAAGGSRGGGQNERRPPPAGRAPSGHCTSPYSFPGAGKEACACWPRARDHRPSGRHRGEDSRGRPPRETLRDCLQIGAPNIQNFNLLQACGKSRLPVLLKRGLSSTLEEFLMAAEHILASGKPRRDLCERGIRTFERATRTTLDLSAVAVLKEWSHLPVIVDPSHGTGQASLVPPDGPRLRVAAGADGLLIEVHPHPERPSREGRNPDPRGPRPKWWSRSVRAVARGGGDRTVASVASARSGAWLDATGSWLGPKGPRPRAWPPRASAPSPPPPPHGSRNAVVSLARTRETWFALGFVASLSASTGGDRIEGWERSH